MYKLMYGTNWSQHRPYDLIFKKLRNNEQGRYSITRPYEAGQIIDHMDKAIMAKLGIPLRSCVVTDCTAGVGGDTINFSYNAMHVNAIEIAIDQYELLEHNCMFTRVDNVTLYHGNCIDIVPQINQTYANTILYLDPPWGGIGYKNHGNLQITVGGFELPEIVKLFSKFSDMIFIKLPLNADMSGINIENRFLINNKKDTPSFYLVQCSHPRALGSQRTLSVPTSSNATEENSQLLQWLPQITPQSRNHSPCTDKIQRTSTFPSTTYQTLRDTQQSRGWECP